MKWACTSHPADVLLIHRRVVQDAPDGLSTKKIAGEMNLSERDVKLHLRNIFKKLDVSHK